MAVFNINILLCRLRTQIKNLLWYPIRLYFLGPQWRDNKVLSVVDINIGTFSFQILSDIE